jgi:hypothetical protein
MKTYRGTQTGFEGVGFAGVTVDGLPRITSIERECGEFERADGEESGFEAGGACS